MTSIVDDLKRDEGFRASAYKDSLGYLTIGYGFLIDRARGGGIPVPVADAWLHYLIRERAAALDVALPWWKSQPHDVQRALLNMAYQLGVEGLLQFTTTLGLLEQGERAEAADQALKSLWARQTPARAKRVTDLLRGPTP